MKDNYSYVAFFDLDKTIISLNSGAVLVTQAYRDKLMSRKDLMHGFYLSLLYKFGWKEVTKIVAEMAQWMNGLSQETINKLCENIVNNELIKTIRPEMYAEIRLHKEHNAELVILSAAMPNICLPFAKHLEMDEVICTELEIINGVYTGNPIGRFCIGEEKLTRLKNYCMSNNYNLSEAYYYGDSFSDYPALEVVGFPVCINPDDKLRKVALKKNWVIQNWH